MLWLLAACGYSLAKLMPIAKLEPLKRREQGQDCGVVLDPFSYVDFLSKRLLPSFTAKACSLRFFLCLDFLDQAGRRHYADHTAATAELLEMSPPRSSQSLAEDQELSEQLDVARKQLAAKLVQADGLQQRHSDASQTTTCPSDGGPSPEDFPEAQEEEPEEESPSSIHVEHGPGIDEWLSSIRAQVHALRLLQDVLARCEDVRFPSYVTPGLMLLTRTKESPLETQLKE
ncbi:hypothetical protein AK812_SmicGene35163, partial [Symbiodinium microadriaticum]